MPLKVLLLPGMDGTGLLFKPLLKTLPRHVSGQVVAYPEDKIVSYADLLESIELAREPFAIIAESYSGPLAIRLAASRPKQLKALVLSATFVRCPWPRLPRWMAAMVRPGLFSIEPPDALMRWLQAGVREAGKMARDLREAIQRVRPEVLAARLREVIAADVSKEFKQLDVPMLYLNGTRDRLVPLRIMKELRLLRPDLRTLRLDAPHFVLQTRPTEAARAIDEFLENA